MTTMKTWLFAASMLSAIGAITPASAAVIANRTSLNVLLGTTGTLETFERYTTTAQKVAEPTLNATTNWGSLGTGMVAPGVTYSTTAASKLVLNVNGYYGLATHTLGTTAAAVTLTYAAPVTAFGVDLQGYSGFGGAGTISVYDTTGALLNATRVQAGYNGASSFFGYESAGGIGKVVVAADSNNYLMIDNHGFGASAVPEPATWAMMLVGFGGIGATMRYRRRSTKAVFA